MDKRTLDYLENQRNSVDYGYKKCGSNAYVRRPTCINDDFCVSAPYDMNDGILTMAFVDMQPLDEVYSLQEAFCNGTLFPNINKPFYGGKER